MVSMVPDLRIVETKAGLNLDCCSMIQVHLLSLTKMPVERALRI